MNDIKEWMHQIIHGMPEGASFEEILRELVMRRSMEKRARAEQEVPLPKGSWPLHLGIQPWTKSDDSDGNKGPN